jgi:RNA polymerase sigma-70 factor (ECF subfamily)
MGIARKQLLKHLERKRPRGHEVPHSQVDLVDIRTSPTGVLARLDQQRVFLDALLPLAPEYREVIELYFWQDRKIPEIAAALEIAVGTVKSRLHRGKAAMRAAIEAMGIAPQLRAGTLGELDSRPIDDD